MSVTTTPEGLVRLASWACLGANVVVTLVVIVSGASALDADSRWVMFGLMAVTMCLVLTGAARASLLGRHR